MRSLTYCLSSLSSVHSVHGRQSHPWNSSGRGKFLFITRQQPRGQPSRTPLRRADGKDGQAPPGVEKDFWADEKFDILGKVAQGAVPVILALAVATGFFAAKTYNEGAVVFMEPAKGEDRPAAFFPADEPKL